MAAKKWPKWLVGFSSVVSFTGFLFLIQQPSGTATAVVNGKLTADPIKSLESIETNTVPQPATISVQSGTSAGSAKTFVRSRAEFQQISGLSPEKKSERELLLEQLDWDGLPDNATVVAPITAKSQTAIVQKTTTANAKPKQVKAASVLTPKAKSDVQTRRS